MGQLEMKSTQVNRKSYFPLFLKSSIFFTYSNYYKVLHKAIVLLACETVTKAMTLKIPGRGKWKILKTYNIQRLFLPTLFKHMPIA